MVWEMRPIMVLQLWKKEGNKCQFVNKWGIFSWNRFPILIIYQITQKWKIFRCEHMISKSILNIGIFRNFVKLHRCTLILLLLTKPPIIFPSPLHFWTKISCNQLFPNKLYHENYGTLLSLTHFGKNFVKATFLIYREMLNSWFDEIFFLWKWEIFFQYYFAKNPRNRSIYLCMPFSLHFFSSESKIISTLCCSNWSYRSTVWKNDKFTFSKFFSHQINYYLLWFL